MQENMSLGKRVKKCRSQKGMTQVDLAEKIGVSQGTIASLERRGSMTSPHASKLAEALGVRLKWLLTGEEPMTESSKPKGNAEIIGGFETWDENTPLRDDEVELPFYTEIALSAGTGKLINEDGKIRSLRFSKVSLNRLNVDKSSAVCVKVSGTSMEPVLNDGDTVGIDTANTTIKNGKTYAIRHGEEIRIKTLYNAPMNGLRIVSFNADEYPPETYTAEQIEEQGIIVIGKVFWSSTLWS